MESESELDVLDDRIDRTEAQLRKLKKQRADVAAGVQKIQRVKQKGCRHQPLRYFKVDDKNWRCSVCGGIGMWTDSWSSFGAIGCRKCGAEPAIEAVVCSDKCKDELDASMPKQKGQKS